MLILACLSKQQVLLWLLCTFSPNSYPNVQSMASVEKFFWNFYFFNISLQSISVGFEGINSPRLLKMFAPVAPGHLRQFFIKMVHITHCYPVHISPKRLILLVPGFLSQKLLFMSRNSFVLSAIAVDVVSFIFSLPELSSTVSF